MWDIKKSQSYWVFFSDLPNSPAHAERPKLETSRFKQREINVGFYVSVSPEFNLARVEVESPSLSSRCGNELICVLSIANPHPPPPLSVCPSDLQASTSFEHYSISDKAMDYRILQMDEDQDRMYVGCKDHVLSMDINNITHGTLKVRGLTRLSSLTFTGEIKHLLNSTACKISRSGFTVM